MATAAADKPVMVIGLDSSEHGFYALEWTLDHFFRGPASPFKLIVVHAKPLPNSLAGRAGPGFANMMPVVDLDLKRVAAQVVERAKEICASRSVNDVKFEVVEGDARNVLCDAVDKHHASVLVVGSHGYGAIKRAVLGSVSDYLTHHAHCTVMIVKEPKNKQGKH